MRCKMVVEIFNVEGLFYFEGMGLPQVVVAVTVRQRIEHGEMTGSRWAKGWGCGKGERGRGIFLIYVEY